MTERLFGEFHTEAFYDSRYESLTIEEVMGRQKMPKTVKRRRVAAVFGEGGAVLRSRRGSLSARYAMPRLAWLVLVAAGGVAGFSPIRSTDPCLWACAPPSGGYWQRRWGGAGQHSIHVALHGHIRYGR